MSYATGTTNYNLPQTVGTDKRDWSDTNQAFYDVDEALKAATDGASQAAEDITALTTRVGTAEDDILALKAEDISLDGRLDTAEGAISTLQLQVPDVRSDLEDMITAYNEATATSTHAYSEGDYFIYNDVLYKATTSIGIGDTIVPNTNCSATNVTTELSLGVIASNVSYDNTSSGLTADNVQAAIDEVNSALTSNYSAQVAVSITSETDYTCPSDGVVTVNVGTGTFATIQVKTGSTSYETAILTYPWTGVSNPAIESIFVRKGVTVKVTPSTAVGKFVGYTQS